MRRRRSLNRTRPSRGINRVSRLMFHGKPRKLAQSARGSLLPNPAVAKIQKSGCTWRLLQPVYSMRWATRSPDSKRTRARQGGCRGVAPHCTSSDNRLPGQQPVACRPREHVSRACSQCCLLTMAIPWRALGDYSTLHQRPESGHTAACSPFSKTCSASGCNEVAGATSKSTLSACPTWASSIGSSQVRNIWTQS